MRRDIAIDDEVRRDIAIDDEVRERIGRAEGCAAHFCTLLSCTEPVIPASGVLAGPLRLDYERLREKQDSSDRSVELGQDNIHFPLNVGTLFRLGFYGIERQARRSAEKCGGEEADYLEAIARCYEATVGFVRAHAETAARRASHCHGREQRRLVEIESRCRALAEGAPRTFVEAVQLFWFAWNIRNHGTIGRLDQHLFPFYRNDLEAGRLKGEEAFAVLRELWEGFNASGSGDTLMNLMLGGRDCDGRDLTNQLSYLMIDVALAVRMSEPQLSVRVHARTPESFLDKVAEVQSLGHGHGAVYNDEAIIPSLVKHQVPPESACNYANNGCTEVIIDGESGILFYQMEALKALELTLFNGEENLLPGEAAGQYVTRTHAVRTLHTSLKPGYHTGDFAAMTSFEQFYDAYLRQYGYQLDLLLNRLCETVVEQQQSGVSSPFMAGTFPACLETGTDPLRGGFTVPCNMIFAGSIPTVADGLAAIRKVVFTDRFCRPEELLDALRANFEGFEVLRRRCLAAPKFGNDDDSVDELAADIARFFCARVSSYHPPGGKPVWPALYNFLFNDTAKIVGATPDGRRWKEPVAEHYSPTPGRGKQGPTAVIRSAAKGPLGEACGSSIFHISLSRDTVSGNGAGTLLMRQLVKSALQMGAAVMNIAIYDVEALKKAKVHPEQYEDLIVRVWGFSARFVDLCNDLQDHVIERALGSGE